MKREDHCNCSTGQERNELHLEINHSDGAGHRQRSTLYVNQAWTTLGIGPGTLKYTRYCVCGLKINGRFTNVTRWMIRTRLGGEN